MGASTSWNPQGLSRAVMGLLYLYIVTEIKSYADFVKKFFVNFE
jgi:hypothetical protein